MKQFRYRILVFLLAGMCYSCTKEWLDSKADKKLVTPTKLADLQALLDNTLVLNTGAFGLQEMAEIGSDNYFLEPAILQALSSNLNWQKNAYFFEKDIFQGLTNVSTWNVPYTRVLYANIALDELKRLPATDAVLARNIEGSALFIRAHSLFWLAQLYARPYQASTAGTDPGIPVRLSSDMNDQSFRASVEDTYKQMIADLNNALPLLPSTGINKIRPSKAGCYGLLARVYLSMHRYDEALENASRCLAIQPALMDYNSMVASTLYPVPKFNEEIIYYDINATSIFNPSRCRIDTVFFEGYDASDLRRSVFFKPRTGTKYYTFNGSYDGTFQFFGGITTAEIYLTRAECYARKSSLSQALADLDTLTIRRWKKIPAYTPFTAATSQQALELVLRERRKELCFRGLRWMDLRRLNLDGVTQTIIRRRRDDNLIVLPPGDARYVYPIPDEIIALTGMEQNMR